MKIKTKATERWVSRVLGRGTSDAHLSLFSARLRMLSVFLISAILLVPSALIGCTPAASTESESSGSGAQSAESSDPISKKVVIGTMATEDILPMWVAEAEDIFAEQNLDATIETFQSAQELSTAVVSGAVDIAMTDIMVSATLAAAGTPVTMEWVTLGVSAQQGRMGIMTSPESGITSLKDLAGVPIGVGSCTVLEYVMDNLLLEAGLTEDQIVSEEIKKVPVRFELMSSNQVAAAVLPGSYLALGEATGMKLLADDSSGTNLSQSVMIVRSDFSRTTAGIAIGESLARVWDTAVERINADPEAYRSLLIEKAQLSDLVKDSYVISVYPKTQRPNAGLVTPVLDWMYKKGYLETELIYDYSTGSFKT